MLGIMLDTLVIMVLIRLLTGEENDGWGKPALIAVLSSVAMIAANVGASNADPGSVLLILFGSLAGVGVFVFAGSWLLLNVEPLKALLVAILFVVYKALFIILFAFAFA